MNLKRKLDRIYKIYRIIGKRPTTKNSSPKSATGEYIVVGTAWIDCVGTQPGEGEPSGSERIKADRIAVLAPASDTLAGCASRRLSGHCPVPRIAEGSPKGESGSGRA